MIVEIVPQQSIGNIKLGASVDSIPHAEVEDGVGSANGINFLVEAGKVVEVWINDLREFSAPVGFRGHTIPKDISLSEIKKLFGPCRDSEDLLGGALFECPAGVTIGCDAQELGDFVQIRLKR